MTHLPSGKQGGARRGETNTLRAEDHPSEPAGPSPYPQRDPSPHSRVKFFQKFLPLRVCERSKTIPMSTLCQARHIIDISGECVSGMHVCPFFVDNCRLNVRENDSTLELPQT